MKSPTTRPSRPEIRLFRKTAIDVLDAWRLFSKDPKEFVTDSSSFEIWSNLGVESLMRAVSAWIARATCCKACARFGTLAERVFMVPV
jgi:hypothetical protein